MPTCQVKASDAGAFFCNREIWNNEEQKCIFHCMEKPIALFNEKLFEELKLLNDNIKTEIIDFKYFIFPPNFTLSDISIHHDINFDYSQFCGDAKFYGTYFHKKASFNHAKFQGDTSFESAHFYGFTFFMSSKFFGVVEFRYSSFENTTYFHRAEFHHGVQFKNMKIEKNDFELNNASFWGQTKFEEIKSNSPIRFRNALFYGEISLLNSEFTNYVDFAGTIFYKDVKFSEAKFLHKTNFSYTIFKNKVDIKGISFSGDTKFECTEFFGNADFSEIKIMGEFNLRNIHPKGEFNFRNVFLEEAKYVIFKNVDLKRFLFMGTNIQRIRFFGHQWLIKGTRKHMVYDEEKFKGNNKITLINIEQLNRGLQSSYEDMKAYHIAGDFFIGAMEMQRRQIARKSNAICRWLRQNIFSLIALYKLTSFYGERYIRTFGWMLLFLLLFPCIYLLTGFTIPVEGSLNNQKEFIQYKISLNSNFSIPINDYAKALVLSLHASTFQKFDPLEVTLLSRTVSIVQSIISAILLSLFLLAIRRRFRR